MIDEEFKYKEEYEFKKWPPILAKGERGWWWLVDSNHHRKPTITWLNYNYMHIPTYDEDTTYCCKVLPPPKLPKELSK